MIAAEEESPLTYDRSTDGSAELGPFQRVARALEKIARIQYLVPIERKEITMKVVGTGLGNDIHNTAGIVSELCAVVTGLYTEFLKSIGKREWLVYIGKGIHVATAVQSVADLILARAIGGDSYCAREMSWCARYRLRPPER